MRAFSIREPGDTSRSRKKKAATQPLTSNPLFSTLPINTSAFGQAFKRQRLAVTSDASHQSPVAEEAKSGRSLPVVKGQSGWLSALRDYQARLDAGYLTNFTILSDLSAGWLDDYEGGAPVSLEPRSLKFWLDPACDIRPILATVHPERLDIGDAA